MKKIAIIGTVGVPGKYGGFETLADNLVCYHAFNHLPVSLTVYCEAAAYSKRPSRYLNADLKYIPLKANGIQSIPYDIFSLFWAVFRRTEVILLLGVSGALALPLVRLFSRARIFTNIDGIEWKREKWSSLAKLVLRLSEWAAVKWSHVVVADNQAIAEHVASTYGVPCKVIAYGGDHALATEPNPAGAASDLPVRYALALCRIEPENNVAMILDAFYSLPEQPLVFVGNWDKSDYGRELYKRYGDTPNLYLLDPVYDPGQLRCLRDSAWLYVHGHSAGGTNPSLVEMMHFGIPVIAYGCSFNRYSTEQSARYFLSAEELQNQLLTLDNDTSYAIGKRMVEIARRRFTWAEIGRAYFELMDNG
ncbi:DUF1972 domain-containing protein [Endozoicomonas sp. YOMI1]|uniref:DUF1972 domain-containing protein n=1 Tax=Endozoicomonas sp. YOMI1 TaxID=2828739 RepID=UPI0021482B21|nr:DUF1972 domain-containing protein [Endozoicomonas sp. YOMI1]